MSRRVTERIKKREAEQAAKRPAAEVTTNIDAPPSEVQIDAPVPKPAPKRLFKKKS